MTTGTTAEAKVGSIVPTASAEQGSKNAPGEAAGLEAGAAAGAGIAVEVTGVAAQTTLSAVVLHLQCPIRKVPDEVCLSPRSAAAAAAGGLAIGLMKKDIMSATRTESKRHCL
jgi:hypothetical protein